MNAWLIIYSEGSIVVRREGFRLLKFFSSPIGGCSQTSLVQLYGFLLDEYRKRKYFPDFVLLFEGKQ